MYTCPAQIHDLGWANTVEKKREEGNIKTVPSGGKTIYLGKIVSRSKEKKNIYAGCLYMIQYRG